GCAAEVTPRGGLEPDDVPAERGIRGIERKNLLLRIRELEPSREHHLDELVEDAAILACARQSRDLHRERASAAHDSARLEIEICRASERQRIHSEMRVEAFVFVLDQRAHELLRQRFPCRKAPLTVLRDARAEQLTFAIQNDRRERLI